MKEKVEQALNKVRPSLGAPAHRDVQAPRPVITSYSIHYTKLYENRDAGYMQGRSLVELDKISAESHFVSENKDAVFLVQTGTNLGYAGGNNVGIRLALNQEDMQYVWILNNDTEVEPNSLLELVKRCKKDPGIGICGSRLVYRNNFV